MEHGFAGSVAAQQQPQLGLIGQAAAIGAAKGWKPNVAGLCSMCRPAAAADHSTQPA
jgi:hypothetical protein